MAPASAVRKESEFELDDHVGAPSDDARLPTLTERLDAKLADLAEGGYQLRYLEIGREELVTLFTEGGDEAILLDPDPDVDRAWDRGLEVRATEKDCIWIWIEGEVEGDLSAHLVS